jgi:hypothetical protein
MRQNKLYKLLHFEALELLIFQILKGVIPYNFFDANTTILPHQLKALALVHIKFIFMFPSFLLKLPKELSGWIFQRITPSKQRSGCYLCF